MRDLGLNFTNGGRSLRVGIPVVLLLLEGLTTIDVEADVLNLVIMVVKSGLVEQVVSIAIEHHYVSLSTPRPRMLFPILHG